jgi:hypothetical protein
MLDLYKKPKVKDISRWVTLFESNAVVWQVAENHNYFHRVRVEDERPKYFYGEMAFHQARSLSADADFQAWRVG